MIGSNRRGCYTVARGVRVNDSAQETPRSRRTSATAAVKWRPSNTCSCGAVLLRHIAGGTPERQPRGGANWPRGRPRAREAARKTLRDFLERAVWPRHPAAPRELTVPVCGAG